MPDTELEMVMPDGEIEKIAAELARETSSKGRRITEKMVIAALGSIPWVGGFIAAAAEIRGDEAEVRKDDLRLKWLEEHERKLELLQHVIEAIVNRLAELGDSIEERIQSPAYLAIVRQAFRAWDNAETDEKRQYVANLISNAAGSRVCSDDVVRLFIQWLDEYHEAHFAVIREIDQNPGSTRYDIWVGVYSDQLPREDSAEADLYRYLIRVLSLGGVIRLTRDKTEAGQFKRKRPRKRRGPAPAVMESAFEDTKDYVLTELGKQFVHYTLMGDIRRLEQQHG